MLNEGGGGYTYEVVNLWYHLSQAKMIKGGYVGFNIGAGTNLTSPMESYFPRTAAGKNSFIMGMSITDGAVPIGNSWTVSALSYTIPDPGFGNGMWHSFTAPQAYNIDVKLDDGFPAQGNVQTLEPYSGPLLRIYGDWSGCVYENHDIGKYVYDTAGLWQQYGGSSPIANTPPNPENTGCALAIGKAW